MSLLEETIAGIGPINHEAVAAVEARLGQLLPRSGELGVMPASAVCGNYGGNAAGISSEMYCDMLCRPWSFGYGGQRLSPRDYAADDGELPHIKRRYSQCPCEFLRRGSLRNGRGHCGRYK